MIKNTFQTKIKAIVVALVLISFFGCNTDQKKETETSKTEAKEPEYMSATAPIAVGKAPGMKYRLLSDKNGVKEYVLIFAKGDELLSGISDFVKKEKVGSGRFTAIGALSSAKASWLDLNKKMHKVNPVNEQCELVSLIGDIGVFEGTPTVHIHFSVAIQDGTMKGGHLLEAVTNPTVELFMTTFPVALDKQFDPTTDLKIFHPEIEVAMPK